MSDVLKECRHCDVHRIGPSCPNGFAAKPSRTVPAKSGGADKRLKSLGNGYWAAGRFAEALRSNRPTRVHETHITALASGVDWAEVFKTVGSATANRRSIGVPGAGSYQASSSSRY